MRLLIAMLLAAAATLQVAQAYNNGAGARPPMGWNTWCTDDLCGLLDKCSDAEIRTQAESMVSSGMHALGYEYINMDDCWSAATRDANGRLQPDAARFPYGMKALADYVHSLGLKIGLYVCIGTKTCRRDRPGSFGHYAEDAQTFAEWGIDMIKCDNCNKPGQYTELQLYSNYSRWLNASGRPILFSTCEWGDANVQEWGHTVAQMFRIQMDHLPFYNLPTHAAGKGFGQGTINIVEYIATLQPSTFVRQYGWMDPDFLETLFKPTMTARYSKTEITMWSAWSAPLLVATHIDNMSAEKKALLMNAEVIAVDQDASNTAADLMYKTAEGGHIWARTVANGDAVIVMLNPGDYKWGASAMNITATWSLIGINTTTVTNVRDIWANADLPPASWSQTSYEAEIQASDVMYLRVSCASGNCLPK